MDIWKFENTTWQFEFEIKLPAFAVDCRACRALLAADGWRGAWHRRRGNVRRRQRLRRGVVRSVFQKIEKRRTIYSLPFETSSQ